MTELLDATDSQTAMIADLVGSVRAVEETIARLSAVRAGMLAVAARVAVDIARQAAHPDHGDMALRAVAAEIGAAVRASDRTIERRMDEASWAVERFAEVWAAQGGGGSAPPTPGSSSTRAHIWTTRPIERGMRRERWRRRWSSRRTDCGGWRGGSRSSTRPAPSPSVTATRGSCGGCG